MYYVAVTVASAIFLFGTALSASLSGSNDSSSRSQGGNSIISRSPRYNNTADISVLQYALTLENFKAAFYVGALKKLSQADFVAAGLTARDYRMVLEVRDHKVSHVAGLSAVIRNLGAAPVPACTYNFEETDVMTFLGVARVVEDVGVRAYVGAVKDISNPTYITMVASIATVEARHAAFFNYITGKAPAPQPFEIPLTQRQVMTVAAPYIASCSYTLPAAFPTLVISPEPDNTGVSLKLTTEANVNGANCVLLNGFGTNFLVPVVNRACALPTTFVGEVYVILTSAGAIGDLNDSNTLAGPTSFTVPSKGDMN